MSVNMPVHPWPANETDRPTRLASRLIMIALAVAVVLFMIVLVVPALVNQPGLPVITQLTVDTVAPVMVLNATCSPFAALSACVTTAAGADPAS